MTLHDYFSLHDYFDFENGQPYTIIPSCTFIWDCRVQTETKKSHHATLISERPKPEFSAETGTRTEIIPVRFRFGNSYRNRKGHFIPYRLQSSKDLLKKYNDPHTVCSKKLVLVLYIHKNLLYRGISLYCQENISIVYWKYIANSENIMILFRYWVSVSVRFRFGKKFIFRFRSGFGEISFRSFTNFVYSIHWNDIFEFTTQNTVHGYLCY